MLHEDVRTRTPLPAYRRDRGQSEAPPAREASQPCSSPQCCDRARTIFKNTVPLKNDRFRGRYDGFDLKRGKRSAKSGKKKMARRKQRVAFLCWVATPIARHTRVTAAPAHHISRTQALPLIIHQHRTARGYAREISKGR